LSDLKAALDAKALDLGFCAMGITTPDAIPKAADRLAKFVGAGNHGTMGWMTERAAWRGNPAALWPQARSIIMLADNYAPKTDPMATLDQKDRATVSVYARGRDYHDTIKKRLKNLGRWLIDEAGGTRGAAFLI